VSAAELFGGSVGDRDADARLAALRAKPEGMTRTEIRRVVLQGHRSSEVVARAVGLLLRVKLARQEIIQTDDRNSEWWIAATP
jgi:hypothetical protein